jgi:hypothetical protein
VVVIGVPGTGKTMGVGLLCMYMCATIPNFRFMNVAPTLYQSNLMVRTIEDMTYGTPFREKFIVQGKPGWVSKPYTKITFNNGSTAEFMNVANNAVNIQSWYGDWINVDEAGLLDDLDENGTEQLANILIGLATRLRGTRPDGRPRLGRLSMISMAYDCDTLWERYEAGLKKQNTIWSRLVLHNENPYLTQKDIERMRRNVPPGGEAQWMRGERPQRKGAEFPMSILQPMFSKSQWQAAVNHVIEGHEGWRVEFGGAGVVIYEEPPIKGDTYVMAGDPGMGSPPDRNSPTILVFNATAFPYQKARLAAFWWGDGGGSYSPFISKFKEYFTRYHVPMQMRGYDSTSSQKALAELAFTSGEGEVVPLGFEGNRKWEYLSALKLLLSKQVLQVPGTIN